MKVALHKRLLATASALTFAACTFSQAQAADLGTYKPAQADPMPGLTSLLSVWGGVAALNSSDNEFSDDHYWTFGGDARFAGKDFQVDLVASVLSDTDGGDNDFSGSEYVALAAHWLNRGADRTWGLFGGVSGTGSQDTNDSTHHVFGGVEGALFRGQQTFFAQGGFLQPFTDDATDTWDSGSFVRGGVRFFHTNQSRIEADLMVGFGKFDDSGDYGHTLAWGVEYERQRGIGSPYSVYGAYRGHYVENTLSDCSPCDATDHVFTFGFRIAAGQGLSLRERDKVGPATFNIPDFHRGIAWPDDLSGS